MASAESEWTATHRTIQKLGATLRGSASFKVNSTALKAKSREAVQRYFRNGRPELLRLGFDLADLSSLDLAFQELLRLADGNNARSSYLRWIKTIRAAVPDINVKRELLLGTGK